MRALQAANNNAMRLFYAKDKGKHGMKTRPNQATFFIKPHFDTEDTIWNFSVLKKISPS
jgi:hypothetical protein